MEKPICRKCCNHFWFAVLFPFSLCFMLICFNISSLGGGNLGFVFGFRENNNDPLDFMGKEVKPIKGLEFDPDLCLGQYIYVHDLPSKFNDDLVKNCWTVTAGSDKNDMCPYFENMGLGPRIENSQGVFLNNSWYSTNQFMLEVIFHNKMNTYKCLTNDSSLASAIFVPFYAGLDVSKYLWDFNYSVRDSSAHELVSWISKKPEWKRMWGRDHFLVGGRISWDFRRKTDDDSDWGSKLMFLPESNNMTMLSVESSVWKNDFAIPYPTYFHPSKDSEVLEWQNKIRRQKRVHLFTFAGAPRPDDKHTIRNEIIDQCRASLGACKLVDCSSGSNHCDNPANVIKVFQSSVFCLQPRGDSYTRRSTFDTILAGCIPVFFHSGAAYVQYVWYLPKNHSTYSVFIPTNDEKDLNINIKETLLRIPEDEVSAMREEVIKLIPKVIYSDPRSRLETFEDAFDIAVKAVLERVETVRKLTKEGKDPSIGFAGANHWKFKFPLED